MEEEALKRCEHCQARPARRRYCRPCGRMASALYNRALRREAKARGEKYWLEWWEKAFGPEAAEKRREYQRNYMRAYRRRKRGERVAYASGAARGDAAHRRARLAGPTVSGAGQR